jgi:hypothetical protein
VTGERTTAELAAQAWDAVKAGHRGQLDTVWVEQALDALRELRQRAEQAERLECERDEAREQIHDGAELLRQARNERDDYRFWNERVRVCEHHTQDVAAPVGDCLICNAEAAEREADRMREALEAARRELGRADDVRANRTRIIGNTALIINAALAGLSQPGKDEA